MAEGETSKQVSGVNIAITMSMIKFITDNKNFTMFCG